MTATGNCYRLIVAGRIAHAAADIIEARFGSAASVHTDGADTAIDLASDQPSLRALVTLLWDVGHDLLSITQCPDGSHDAGSAPQLLIHPSSTIPTRT
ncbi:MAG TPA: hypothetical protein VES21_07595 [Nocardioidaceae bacterium]|nr:hypothetical protein [Nocardioidaceae bacterium]